MYFSIWICVAIYKVIVKKHTNRQSGVCQFIIQILFLFIHIIMMIKTRIVAQFFDAIKLALNAFNPVVVHNHTRRA